jgi:hypothetical protein
MAITVTSWTIAGKRSDGRSSFQGLTSSVTAALTIARTSVSLAIAERSAMSPKPCRTATLTRT